jgi:hypothetical protein
MKKVTLLVLIVSIFSVSFSQNKKSSTQSRSAKTGKFVTKGYADKHQATTVTSKKKN